MATLASYLAVTAVMAFVLCQDCQAQSTGYVKIKLMIVPRYCDLLYDCRAYYTMTSQTEGYTALHTSSYTDSY